VVRDGLWLAERIGCNHIYVETDSLEVVQAFMEPEDHMIVGMPFIDECRTILARFASSRFSHYPRENSIAADVVSKSVDDSENRFWLDDPPLFFIHS
jgi:hypothetical protein